MKDIVNISQKLLKIFIKTYIKNNKILNFKINLNIAINKIVI